MMGILTVRHFTDQYGVSWLLYVQPYNKKAIF